MFVSVSEPYNLRALGSLLPALKYIRDLNKNYQSDQCGIDYTLSKYLYSFFYHLLR